MDTSKKYIKMCTKAQEIQDLRKEDKAYNEGDFFAESNLTYSIAYYYSSCEEYARDGHRDTIKRKESHETWLPRQDQLQEMIVEECIGFISLGTFERFQIFCDKDWNEFNSFEQLWLAFVMKEKFDKAWNKDKKEWISQL